MAGRKPKSAKYYKSWYDRYANALAYYGIKTKELKKPTAKSLSRVKTQWKGIQKQKRKERWIDLPSVYTASNLYTETPNVSRETSEPTYSDEPLTNEQMEEATATAELEHILSNMRALHGSYMDAQHRPTAKELRNHNTARNNLFDKIEYLRMKAGDYETLKGLKESHFYGQFEATIMGTRYLWEETAYLEGEATSLLDSIIDDVIANL